MNVKTFMADNHNSNIYQIILPTSTQLEMIKFVAINHYGLTLSPSSKLGLIGNYNINSLNFRINDFYLKILTEAQFSPRVNLFPKLVTQMKLQDIPGVGFLKNISGEHISKFAFKDKIYYATLQPFLEGNFFSGSKTSLENIIEVIKKMNDVFSNIKPQKCHQEPYFNFKPKQRLLRVKNSYTKKIESLRLDNYDKMFISIFDQLLSISSFYESIEKTLDKKNIRHFDLHPHNVLLKNDRVIAVLDLDNIAIVDWRISSGFNLYKLGRKAIATEMISVSEFKKIIKNYEGNNELKNFVFIELLQRFLLVLESHYHEKSNIRDGDFFKYLSSLKEIEIMFS